MNRRAISPVALPLILIVLVLVWAIALAPILNVAGDATAATGARDVELFIYENLNIFLILIPLIIWVLYGVWGGTSAN